jgi:hypothetical protein
MSDGIVVRMLPHTAQGWQISGAPICEIAVVPTSLTGS